jgi:hypothetical protein
LKERPEEADPAIRRSPATAQASPAAASSPIPGSGSPLPDFTRSFFEPRFGHGFSRVRVHADADADHAARGAEAQAYTIGEHIVFSGGAYAPETDHGRRLLAHELTHVVQQHSDAREAPDGMLHRRVRPENVSCHEHGLTNPDLTGDEVVQALQDADAEAIRLAQQAEDELRSNLASARAGDPVDAAFDTILQEELGLTLTNRDHFRLIEEQANRFQRVRETLESGYLRYICRGGSVKLVGCTEDACGAGFAFSCPGNRLVVLCQTFWDTPDQQGLTLLHEPFHIWFHMARHATNALRRADASCFESFAARVDGQAALVLVSCVGHTAG